MPISKAKQLKIDFEKFRYYRKKHRGILNWFSKQKSTNFINKYHKNYNQENMKLAYLAGIVDGEGYLKVEKWGTIRLIIGMTDKNTIYWIKKNYGGTVTLQKTPKGGNFYVWRMNQGKDLFYLLFLLIPFLITKKKILVKAFHSLIDKFQKLEYTLYYSKTTQKF